VGDKGARLYGTRPSSTRLRLFDELMGPSGNMGFGWGKQRNKNRRTDNRLCVSPGWTDTKVYYQSGLD